MTGGNKEFYLKTFTYLVLLGVCLYLAAFYLLESVNSISIDAILKPRTQQRNHSSSNIAIANELHLNDSVAFVISTCAKTQKRWSILSAAIDSFEKYNTYPYVVRKIVMNDCDDFVGYNRIQNKYQALNYEFYNTSAAGKRSFPFNKRWIKSYRITLAMMEAIDIINDSNSQSVQWILRTEDDWIFYRYSFIEAALMIYKHNVYMNQHQLIKGTRFKKISGIQFRNIQYHEPPKLDMRHFCGGTSHKIIDGAPIYHTNDTFSMDTPYAISPDSVTAFGCFLHWGFNPNLFHVDITKEVTLRCMNRLIDANFSYRMDVEHCIGCQFKKRGYKMAYFIDNGYVGHGGMIDNSHTKFTEENKIENISVMLDRIEKLNDEWSIRLSDCAYINHRNA